MKPTRKEGAWLGKKRLKKETKKQQSYTQEINNKDKEKRNSTKNKPLSEKKSKTPENKVMRLKESKISRQENDDIHQKNREGKGMKKAKSQ